MPYGLFAEWAAYSRLRPFGELAADYRAACLQESTLAAFSGGELKFRPFAPYFEQVEEIDPADLVAAVEAENRRTAAEAAKMRTGIHGDD